MSSANLGSGGLIRSIGEVILQNSCPRNHIMELSLPLLIPSSQNYFCNFEACRHVLNKKEKKEEKRRVGIAIGELSSCSKWEKENVKNKVTDEMKNGNYFRAKMHGIVHKYNHYRFREVNTEIIFARNWNKLMSRNSESEAWAHYLQLKWGHVKIVWFLLRC